MLAIVKQLAGYAVLIVIVVVAATWMPRHLRRVKVPEAGTEVAELHAGATYPLDLVDASALGVGAIVAYRTGSEEDGAARFARVVAGPGQRVELRERRVLTDGKPPSFVCGERDVPDAGPLLVPAGHVYVISASGEADSRVVGPIPAACILGRVNEE